MRLTAYCLAGDIGFEPMISTSKAEALDQAKLIPNCLAEGSNH